MKRFVYELSGRAVVEAETQEEADKLLWDMTLMEADLEVEGTEVEDDVEQ